MKKVTIFTILLIFVVGVTLTFGFGLPTGPKLKKAEMTLKLSDMNAAFKSYEGTDLDPFKDAPYKYNVYGDADIDTFMTSSHKIGGSMKFANKLMSELYAKVDAAKDAGELEKVKGEAESLSTVLVGVTADATKLVASGSALVKSAPGKFKGNPMNLTVLPSLLGDLKGCLDCLSGASKDAKTLTDKMGPLMDKIKEKGATFAG